MRKRYGLQALVYARIARVRLKRVWRQLFLEIYAIYRPGQTVLGIGDSHTRIIDYVDRQRLLEGYRLASYDVRGATAAGAGNPRSATGFSKRVSKRLSLASRRHMVVVCLGEVDCGYLIWQRQNDSVKANVQRSVDGLEKLLTLVCANHPSSLVTMLGAPLPVLETHEFKDGDLVETRGQVKATVYERQRATVLYNELASSLCARLGIKYADTNERERSVDGWPGSIRRPERGDHHLRDDVWGPLVASALSSCWLADDI